jgi:hypothetical protein
MSEWIFELADSENLVPFDELKNASNRQLTLTLNKAGSFSFDLPLEDELCDCLEEIISCVLIKRKNSSGTLETVWSGPVWSIDEETPNKVSVTAVGWLQTLEKRFISEDITFTDIDAGIIVETILNDSNTEAEEQGGRIFITPGEIATTINRTRSYKANESILSIIDGLSSIENGFDFEVDPETRELNIRAEISSDANAYFEYGVNVQSVRRSSDASNIVNHFTAYGANNQSEIAEDEDSVLRYGHMQESQSLPDVVDSTILAAFANAEVAVRANPLRIYTFTPLKASLVAAEIPRIFEDFVVGDVVKLTVNKGRLVVDRQNIRVFSTTLVFDSNGNEQLTTIQSTAQ